MAVHFAIDALWFPPSRQDGFGWERCSRRVVPGQSISINPVACACDPCGGNGVFGFWLRFGLVTGRCGPAPGPKPRQKDQKSPLGIALK